MAEYRAYIVGDDGHFIGFEPLVCADDSEAIERAKRLVSKHPVEIWSGERLVQRLNARKPRGAAVTHEIKDGRMLPKK
jgi:ABC-type antimicrobial peptide transport system ATPase subunit